MLTDSAFMDDEEIADPNKDKETDWLQLARDAYESSKPYMDAALRPQWERNIRQWQGKHGTDSKYLSNDYGKSKLFRPRTRSVIRKNEAAAAVAYFSTADVVTISPSDDSNPIDLLTAEIAQALLNQRLQKSIPWFHIVVGAYQTAQIYGEVVSYQYWHKDKDHPCIDLVPPENFRIDPAADWIDPINTSPYLIHIIPMYPQDVRDHEGWKPVDDKTMMAASNEYYDSTRMTREDTIDSKSGHDAQSSEYGVVWVRRYIVKKDRQDWIFYTLGSEFLLSDPMPLKEAYWHGERPYVMGSCIVEAFHPHPSGLPEIISDVQQEINDVCNQRMDNVKLALNKRYFVRRGTQVDLRSLTRNIPGSVTLMNDPETDVKVHSTPDVTGSSFQEQDRLNLDFDDLAGTFSGSSVQANRRLNETVGGMNMMSQGANQIAEYQLKTFNETWAEPVLRQLVKLELLYETDQAILKIAGRNSETFKQAGFDIVTDAMMGGEFTLNVNVGTGAANPQSQVERFFYGLQTLVSISPEIVGNINAEEIIKEVFGKLGYKDGKRFFNLGEDDPRISQLQQQIQQLQQELDNKRNAEIDAATVKKINAETTVKNIEGIYSAINAAKEVAILPDIASMADSIYKSGGGQDYNGYPLVDNVVASNIPDFNNNTDPRFPPNPQVGLMSGIEKGLNNE